MLLCNYVFLPPLEPLLALPSPSVAAASLTSTIVVVVLVIDIVVVVVAIVAIHHMTNLSVLQASLLASARRRAWRVVTPLALATVDPEEVNVASLHLHHLRALLSLLHCHEHNAVTLHVPLTIFSLHLVLRWGNHACRHGPWVGVPVHFQFSCTTCGSP